MAELGHKLSKKLSQGARSIKPRPLKYYLSAKYYHLNIGRFATKGYFQVRDFIVKEIPRSKKKKKIKKNEQTENIDHKEQKPDTATKEEAISKGESNIVPSASENKQKTIEEIKRLTKRSNEVLCSAKTVFPFTLFPDDIVLDRTKLTITKRDFFLSSKVMSIRIEDILNVSADVGPFLGSLTIAIRIMSSEDHINVNYLRRADAVRLKHIIQGYVIAQHNKIDVAHLNKDELIETLAELGHDLNR